MVPGQLEDVRVEVLLVSVYETHAWTGRDHLHWGRSERLRGSQPDAAGWAGPVLGGGANGREAELPGDDN